MKASVCRLLGAAVRPAAVIFYTNGYEHLDLGRRPPPAGFIMGKIFTANQLEFVNLIVDHRTEHGVMEPARLYESPFTDIAPYGPDGLFKARKIDELIRVLDDMRATASAAA